MSEAFVRRVIIRPLRLALQANDETRAMIQNARGQILVITEKQIKDIQETVGITGILGDAMWEYLDRLLIAEEKLMTRAKKDAERLEIVKSFIASNNIANARIITTHRNLLTIKNKWIKAIELATSKTLGQQWIDLGHGDKGHAVSEMTIFRGLVGAASGESLEKSKLIPNPADYAAILALQEKMLSEVFDSLNSKKQVFKKRTKLELQTDMRVTGTEISKTYVTTLTFQDHDSNAAEGRIEREQIDTVREFFDRNYGKHTDHKKFFTDSGSASLEEAIEGVIFNSFDPKSGTYTGPKGASKYTSAHKLNETIVTENIIETHTIGKAKKFSKPPRVTTKTPNQPSKVNIVALLNTKLPQEIRSRMTYPRLVNRTGRFSESVQVLSADTTAKNSTSFAYTYQKDPYQLFERGKSRLATPDREPRDIIDASIRSIAQEMMLGRFYTRRV